MQQNRPVDFDTDIESPFYSIAAHYGCEGLACKRSGQYEAAEKRYFEALNIQLKHFGANSKSAAVSHNNLGELYIEMKRLDEAEKHLELAVKIRNAVGHTLDAATSRENLAIVYEMRGDLLAAKEMRKSTGEFACANYHCPGQVFNKSELKGCSMCTAIYYCGRACQKADWKRHKKYCRQLE